MYSSPQFIPRNAFHHLESYRVPSQSSLYSSSYQPSLIQYNGYANYHASSLPHTYGFTSEITDKGLHFSNTLHESKRRDDVKLCVNEDYKLVPVFFDESVVSKHEDEPIYYDCDTNSKNVNGCSTFGRNFNVRSLTIHEENYGEI